MSELINELRRHLEAIFQKKDPEKSFLAFAEYLYFIKETPPLHGIARKIFTSGGGSQIARFNKVLTDAELKGEDETDVWADMNAKILGKPSKYDQTFLLQIARAQIRMFQVSMEDGIQQWGVQHKTKIVIDEKNQQIYLFADPEKNYPMKARGWSAGTGIPLRLKIVIFLHKHKNNGGFSVKRLAEVMERSDLSDMRKQIRAINRRFEDKVYQGEELITIKGEGKQIYLLNNAFEFKKK